MIDTPGHERRVGRRHDVGPVIVRWDVDTNTEGSRRRGRRRRPEPRPSEAAGLLDVSVSGVCVMARTAGDLRVGSTTVVSIKGARGPVIARRISPSAKAGFSIYGLEFGDGTSPLTQMVHRDLLATGATVDEFTWHAVVRG
ncbi:hypothetical protein [Iamia sp.]|uniref:hypothetical protein n=1 Tax=Iamia sp. TaxID=2722710 RepID=UPI002CAB26C1|nr:hypothetical protein [Iamia sp.]HXH56063.1 hypothetical protein [Iamia sp.]